MIYNSVLNDLIKLEKDGKNYFYPEQDKPILKEMFAAINNKCNTEIFIREKIRYEGNTYAAK